jgi:hypothetical protein
MDWFETAMKIVVVIGSLGVLSLVLGVARKFLGLRRPGAREWMREMAGGRDPAGDGELEEIRQNVERLGGEVAELHERLDFAERMLAQQRDRPALPDR